MKPIMSLSGYRSWTLLVLATMVLITILESSAAVSVENINATATATDEAAAEICNGRSLGECLVADDELEFQMPSEISRRILQSKNPYNTIKAGANRAQTFCGKGGRYESCNPPKNQKTPRKDTCGTFKRKGCIN